MRQNLTALLLETLPLGRRIRKQPLKGGGVERIDQPLDTVILFARARHSARRSS